MLKSNGARQGGILLTLLFSFFLNEAVDVNLGQTVGSRLADMSYNIICYAYDKKVSAPSEMGLRNLVVSLAELPDRPRLKVNTSISC